jgi:hypothetical protein
MLLLLRSAAAAAGDGPAAAVAAVGCMLVLLRLLNPSVSAGHKLHPCMAGMAPRQQSC